MRTQFGPLPVGENGQGGDGRCRFVRQWCGCHGDAILPAGGANFLTFITGFEFSGLGATAGSVVLLTISNLSSPSPTYIINVPAGVTTSVPTLVVEFPMPISANALDTTIAVSVPSPGAGNTNAAVVAHGFPSPHEQLKEIFP